jgi:hypothetical protein
VKALTIYRPWPWAIVHLETNPKRVENRSWAAPRWLIGQVIALHAGKRWDENGEAYIVDELDIVHSLPEVANQMGVVGTARVVGCWRNEREVPAEQRRWFFGPFGWVLDEVRALRTPIIIPGAQGLWGLPPTVEQRIREELAS